MATKMNRNQEFLGNCMWQRNLSNARNININVENIFDNSFKLLLDLLNNYKSINDTDPIGLLLSLFTCIGHFCANSTVNITNHITNLNVFLLLIGPSGCGKSKIISPIKKSVINTIRSLGISKDEAGIVDEFTTASLSTKLAKSNVFIVTDEAEKPLLSMGFYSPLSEGSAADRISGCKFFGTIPTTKDTMTYHLEISLHLSFVGATTGRLWHRLITYYAQGHQSDGFSERFIHYAMPRKKDLTINLPQSLDYDDAEDDNNDIEDDMSDDEYELEKQLNNIKRNLPSLSQILIVCHLLGKREFVLSRNGTKKFYNKVRQYQELSQIEKSDDVNYGSRMGKSAEILCKLAAISQIIKISIEILTLLQEQNKLQYDDTTFSFIRNVTQIIQHKYPSTNTVLQVQSSSCRLAGNLLCTHLLKMLLAIYNIEPILPNDKTLQIESISIHSTTNKIRKHIFNMPQLFFLKRDLTGSMGLLRHFPLDIVNTVMDELINYQLIRQGPYITTTSRGIVHMKSFPSDNILNDPMKRGVIEQIFIDINMDFTGYMSLLCSSIIKDKQILTTAGKQILMLPEHNILYQHLKSKYPNLNLDIHLISNHIDNLQNTNNDLLSTETTHNQNIVVTSIDDQNSDHNIHNEILNVSNQSSALSRVNWQNEKLNNMLSSNNIHQISPTHFSILNNPIINQLSTVCHIPDMTNKEQNLSVLENTTSPLDLNTHSNMSQKLSTFTQKNSIEQIEGDNLNSNNKISICSATVTPNNILTHPQQMNNTTTNIEQHISMSPTTNILLSTSMILDLNNQITSNILNEHNYTTFSQAENNDTRTLNITSTISERSESIVHDQAPFNLYTMDIDQPSQTHQPDETTSCSSDTTSKSLSSTSPAVSLSSLIASRSPPLSIRSISSPTHYSPSISSIPQFTSSMSPPPQYVSSTSTSPPRTSSISSPTECSSTISPSRCSSTISSPEQRSTSLSLSPLSLSPKTSVGRANSSIPLDLSHSSKELPAQPKLSSYPTNKHGRSFRSIWYSNFPWLEYSIKQDAVFCYYCRHFSEGFNLLSRQQSDAFLTGYNNWKNAIAKNYGFSRHETSAAHKFACANYQQFALRTSTETTIMNVIDKSRVELI
ncbi:unnamed protein product [Rotaria magnacalcarata]|uniref:TTF-type domain-containing protein n=1 Tax=Rotaria magnacalcarata TaxID=392030 RepID=A0A819RWQ3_9BILA|nr:unnamed protein product [Rotaria magnacalcarata]